MIARGWCASHRSLGGALLALTVAAVLVAFEVVPLARAAMRAGSNGLLVFSRAPPGGIVVGDTEVAQRPRLYTVEPDGSGLTALVPPGAVSPQGTRLAFTDSAGRLLVAARDGSAARRVLRGRRWRAHAGVREDFPVWSPDGRWIAFVRVAWNVERVPVSIWRVRADGSGLQRLAGLEHDVASLKWSPDERELAFLTGQGVGHQLHVVDADGTRLHLVRRGASYTSVDWAPDSRRLVCATVRGDQPSGLAIIDGRLDRQLTTGDDGPAAWSPDGKLIAFAHTTQRSMFNAGLPGAFQLNTIGVDGQGQRTIASFDGSIWGSIDWRTS